MPEVNQKTDDAGVMNFIHNPFLANFISQESLVLDTLSDQIVSYLVKADTVFADIKDQTARQQPMSMDDKPLDDDENFWPKADSWMAQYRPYNVKNGVLTIPVKGALIANFPYTINGWVTGYEYIWKAYERGMSDANVRGIALDVNSPGGEVSKNFDMVDAMFEKRGTKPVIGIANEHAYSAAYSIISVADKVVVARTGGVGSIGVVTAHIDYSKMLEKSGIKITFIKNGEHKTDGNPYEPLKDSVEARIQKRIDETAAIFHATVARNRGMDIKDVRATQALTYSADESIKIGLADEVGSWNSAMESFTKSTTNNGRLFAMSKTNEESASAKEPTAQETAAQIEAAKTEGKAEGVKAGAIAERDRIKAINNSDEAKTRPLAAMRVALSTDMNVDAAKEFLAGLPEEPKTTKADAGNAFTKAMNTTDNPNVGATDGNANDDGSQNRASSLLASHALVHGKKKTDK